MKINFKVGDVVFFSSSISPWFWHKGVVCALDEKKGCKIGKKWYTLDSVLKETPHLNDAILNVNTLKMQLMQEGKLQYEGEELESYLSRIREE